MEQKNLKKSRVMASFSRCFALVLIPTEPVWLSSTNLVVIALTVYANLKW